MNPAVPTRSLRIKKYASRLMYGAKVSLEVKYTVSGAGWSRPRWRMSPATPTTSSHGFLSLLRIRLPIAAAGEPHSRRARVSETMTT